MDAINRNENELAPWRSPLARALHRNRSLVYSRYLQLATITSQGRPANRTIVFRGFRTKTNQIQFVTDARSQKFPQINHQPWGEACWYFPKSREQFRLAGHLTLVTQQETDASLAQDRLAMWQQLSDSARLQFTWPEPGQPRCDPFPEVAPEANQPVPNFCLLLLEPSQVDHLELRGEPQNRSSYTLQADRRWTVQALNP